jgi:hypothetical protein
VIEEAARAMRPEMATTERILMVRADADMENASSLLLDLGSAALMPTLSQVLVALQCRSASKSMSNSYGAQAGSGRSPWIKAARSQRGRACPGHSSPAFVFCSAAHCTRRRTITWLYRFQSNPAFPPTAPMLQSLGPCCTVQSQQSRKIGAGRHDHDD